MPTDRFTRREFFARSAVGTAAVLAGAHTLARGDVLGANERICVGVIGAGSRAGELMKDVHKAQTDLNVEITAVCDVWRPNREAAAAVVRDWYGREPRQFTRYQDLIALDDVDAVIIATPDFGHSKILAEALLAGKDAYVEKPMVTELEDAKTALDAATETGRVVQVGTQRRSEGRWKAVAKMIRSGILGTISRVEIGWNDAGPRWKRGTAGV
mgnify:FL=1